MRKFLTTYFYYSRSERNGVVILAALSLGFLMLPKLFNFINSADNTTDFSNFEREITAFIGKRALDTEGATSSFQSNDVTLFPFNPNNATKEDLMRLGLSPKVANTFVHFREKGGRFFKKEDFKKIYGVKESDYERLESFIQLENSPAYGNKMYNNTGGFGAYNNAKNAPRNIELKPFDPNTATENDLLCLGIDEKSVKILLKYREKGGHFRTKEDLKKVYGFSDIDFLRLNAYIQIAENQPITRESNPTLQSNTFTKKAESTESKPVDLNQANLDDLLQLRGIGRTFALRILEHRERLGGFSSLNQLKEVYGLPDSTLRNISPYLRLTTTSQRKIFINKTTIETFTHPYLTRKQAEAIIRYRVNHGAFKNLDDLMKSGVLTENMAEKLKPYLIFD
jgi:DNA uptake protein ComE-like DNA-binding protein